MGNKTYRYETCTFENHKGEMQESQIKLANNEKLVKCELGKITIERDGFLLSKHNKGFHGWSKYRYIDKVTKRVSNLIPDDLNVGIFQKEDKQTKTIYNVILSTIGENKKTIPYISFFEIDKKLNNELLFSENMTDLDIFMFIYYEIYNKNYQATYNYLVGYKKWRETEVLYLIKDAEFKYYKSIFKPFIKEQYIELFLKVFDNNFTPLINFNDYYTILMKTLERPNNEIKKTKRYYYFVDKQYIIYPSTESLSGHYSYAVDYVYNFLFS